MEKKCKSPCVSFGWADWGVGQVNSINLIDQGSVYLVVAIRAMVIPNDLNGQICLLQFHKGYTLLLLEVFDGFLTSSAILRPRMAGH